MTSLLSLQSQSLFLSPINRPSSSSNPLYKQTFHHKSPLRHNINSSFRPDFNLSIDDAFIQDFFHKTESLLYTLADAAVSTSTSVKDNGDWFTGITNIMETVLKILKDGLSGLHVPYSYGFAIILLTVIVKAATFPLTKKQVESGMAMKTLQPQIKAIQQQYKGDQGLLTEGFFWIPSLAGPTTVAARQNGSGISWIFPFVSNDPNMKTSQALTKVLPLMIGYFALSVPSGLSLYWLTNNILSTTQQVWLQKLGGATNPNPVRKWDSSIKQVSLNLQELPIEDSATKVVESIKKETPSRPRPGDRFKMLKEQEARKKKEREEAIKGLNNEESLDDEKRIPVQNGSVDGKEEPVLNGRLKKVINHV
ncbi:hypothetical protein ACHQM5_019086 [Ranunculus cassubicifolius]